MLTHFQYQPLFTHSQMPGWQFSFYFKKKKINGIYQSNGEIEWTANAPESEDQTKLKEQIHSLMLFHVYE